MLDGPMRIGLLLLIMLTFALPIQAGEWKKQTHEDSIIEMHTGWDWTKPQRGNYWVFWNDSFTVQTHTASWELGTTPRLGIKIKRLAPQRHWLGRSEEANRLDKDFLEWWYYLKGAGVSNIVTVQCEARDCVTFTAGGLYNCGAFVNWSGQLNSENDTDLVAAYYCVGQSIPVTTEKLDIIFASLAIRGDDGGYVKRATTGGAGEQRQEDAQADLTSRAEKGDAEAQYQLGYNYQAGAGVQKDIFAARRWYPSATRIISNRQQRGIDDGLSELNHDGSLSQPIQNFLAKQLATRLVDDIGRKAVILVHYDAVLPDDHRHTPR